MKTRFPRIVSLLAILALSLILLLVIGATQLPTAQARADPPRDSTPAAPVTQLFPLASIPRQPAQVESIAGWFTVLWGDGTRFSRLAMSTSGPGLVPAAQPAD